MFEITPEEQLRVNGYIVYNSCKALNFPERKAMICDIAEIDDVVKAIELIGRYFEKERGFIHIDTFIQQLNRINSKYPKVAHINTTSRNMLYPKLAERCKSDINKFIEGKFKQQRAERYIDDFMKQWEQRKYTQQVQASTPLPVELQTDEAIKRFERAEKAGIIESTQTGYRKKGISKALLAYFLQRVYLQDNRTGVLFPDKELSGLFNESRLGAAVTSLMNNKHGKPKGYKQIDDLFID